MEKFFIDKGHTVGRPTDDYGTDLLVNTFDEDGYAENGEIRIQLKASDSFDYSNDGKYLSFKTETKHYHSWVKEPMPLFLVLYDAKKTKAYWLYVQAHFAAGVAKKPKKKAKSITIRVPVKNEFTEETVDYMRERKAVVLKTEIKHEE